MAVEASEPCFFTVPSPRSPPRYDCGPVRVSNATNTGYCASYDAVGHLLSATNPDSSYSYSYDGVDRVSSIDNTGTVGVPAVKFNYSYDAVGNLLTVNDSINGTSAGITGYTYDLLNRVTKLTQAGAGVQTKRADMAYNAVNQLTGLSRSCL